MTTAGLYFYNYNSDSPQLGNAPIDPFLHPAFAGKLFIFSLGNVTGKPLPIPLFSQQNHPVLGSASPWIIAFGVVILTAAVLAVARAGFRDAKERPEPLGVSLILFAFVFDASIAIGRGLYGYGGVSASRYATYSMLALVGTYLVVISRPSPDPVRARVGRSSPVDHSHPATASRLVQRPLAVGFRALPAVVVGCVLIQALAGYGNGWSGGQNDHNGQIVETKALRSYHSEKALPKFLVPTQVLAGHSDLIRVAQLDKLSLFASS